MYGKNLSLGKKETTDRIDRKENSTVGGFGDRFFLLLILLAVTIFFSKTVFLGLPISKICRLAEWDSMFSAFSTGRSSACDPSVIQLLVPSYFLVAKIWHGLSGIIPLWNPYSGFGAPLVGDIQATVFSPLRLLFNLFPSMYTYNLTMVAEVAICALGMYGLSRVLGLAKYASLFAALTIAFCPYMLWYLELASGTSQTLFPVVFCAFAWLARDTKFVRAALAGAACAVLILSGHPESSFFGIIFASLLMTLLAAFAWRKQGENLLAALRRAFLALLMTAASAFCLSAPALIPFVEFLQNSDCYKYSVQMSAWAPWQGLVYNIFSPGFGPASPYNGCIAAVLFLVSLAFVAPRDARVRCLVILAAIVLAVASTIEPLHFILEHGPGKYIITVYCMPIFIMCLALISAFGLSYLVDKDKKANVVSFLLAGALVVLLPWLLSKAGANLSLGDFDAILPKMHFDLRSWRVDMFVLLGGFATYLLARFAGRERLVLFAFVAIALNFCSQSVFARLSLPVEPKFDYPVTAPIAFLHNECGRAIVLGDHLMRPNTNVVYGISQMQAHNPLYPHGFLDFMKATGADVGEFSQSFDDNFPSVHFNQKLLNLASARYVVSLLPLFDSTSLGTVENLDKMEKAGDSPFLVSKLLLNKQELAIFGKLSFAREALSKYVGGDIDDLSYSFALLNKKGNVFWFGDQKSIFDDSSQNDRAITFSVPLSESAMQEKELVVGLQLFDRKKTSFVIPKSTKSPVISLGTVSCNDARTAANCVRRGAACRARSYQRSTSQKRAAFLQPLRKIRQYRLVKQYDHNIRIYENQAALPQAFVVHKVRNAESDNQALNLMGSNDFEPRQEIVVVNPRANGFHSASAEMTANTTLIDKVDVSRPNTNQVMLNVVARSPGYLILTDSFYPGWKAFVDGRPVNIVKADYMFRAVPVAAGSHKVSFVYQPLSFFYGCILFLLFCCFLGFRLITSSGRSASLRGNRQ